MTDRGRTGERLAALLLLAVVLMVPPVLSIFNRPERVLGIPVLYVYLFCAWALLIGLAALLVERGPPARPSAKAPAPLDVRDGSRRRDEADHA